MSNAMNNKLWREAYMKRLLDDDIQTSGNTTQPNSIHFVQGENQTTHTTQPINDNEPKTISSGINDLKLMQSLGVPDFIVTNIDTLTKENEELKEKIERLTALSKDSITKMNELQNKVQIAQMNSLMMNAGILKNFDAYSWMDFQSQKSFDSRLEELNTKLSKTKNSLQKTIIKNEIESIKEKTKKIQDDREKIHIAFGVLSNKYYPSMLLNDNKIQLLELIGKGGSAHVWKAFDYEQVMVVAVKISSMIGNQHLFKYLERIRRERDIMEATNHKNVVNIFNWFSVDDDQVMVMEYCENGDLNSLMQKHGKFNEIDAHSIITQVIDGLASLKAKENGTNEVVIHYDLKPANILFDKDLTPKIADFGLSKISDDGNSLALSTLGVGTPGYSAPETYNGCTEVSSSADTWSIGIIFYEMLTNDLQLKNNLRKGSDIETEIRGTASKKAMNLSEDAKNFIVTCLTRDPVKRPTIKALQNDPYIRNVPEPAPKKKSRSKEKIKI